jgi:hypothetical protein
LGIPQEGTVSEGFGIITWSSDVAGNVDKQIRKFTHFSDPSNPSDEHDEGIND